MKAILVIDMPDKCQNCPCFCHLIPKCQADFGREMGEAMCRIGRPDWCPLKPMPSKKVPIFDPNIASYDEEYEKRIMYEIDGYNRCIDEIMGETE